MLLPMVEVKTLDLGMEVEKVLVPAVQALVVQRKDVDTKSKGAIPLYKIVRLESIKCFLKLSLS